MKQSTSFAQMANKQSISLSSALRANTPPTKGQTTSRKFLTLSIFFLLSFFCTTHTWGAEGDIIKSFDCTVSAKTTYARYTPTCDGITWNISWGQTDYIGTNKTANYANLKISNSTDLNAAKGVNSSINSRTQGYVTIIPQSAMSRVGKITISCTALSGSPKVYVVSSTSLSTSYSQIKLKTGNGLSAQGATMSTSGLTFEFDTQTQETYYAVVLYSTAWYRLTETSIEFIEGASAPTTYTVTLNPNYPEGKTGVFKDKSNKTINGNLELSYASGTASKQITDLYTSLTLDGYDFGGWYNAKGSNPGEVSGSPCTNTGNITGDKTYYAKWTQKVYTVTATSNNNNYGTVSVSGTTITASPKTGYTYANPAYIVTSGTAIVTQNGNTFTVSPSTNCTVCINFEAKPKYTVTLVPGSGSVTDTELEEESAGAGVTLPEPTLLSACQSKGWSFAGWAEASVETETEDAPTTLYEADNTYKPTDNTTTLYAVYKRTEETEGTPTTENKTYTHTITSKTWDANGAKTLSNISWTLSNNGDYYGYDGTKGQQVGSSGSPAKSMTLTTSGFASATKITAVKISTSGASSISGNVSVKVGTTAYTSGGSTTKSLTSTNTQYEFTGSSTGNVTISWAQTSSKAIYFKKIEVDYQTTTAGGTTTTTYYHSTPDCGTPSNTYTIKINPTINGSVSVNPKEAAAGTTITLNPSPGSGFKLATLTVTRDDNDESVQVTNNQFTMPASNVTVTATFQAIQKLATPTNLGADNITTTSATLTWEWNESTFEAQLQNYNVYIYDATGTNKLSGPVTATDKSLSTTKINGLTLSPGTTYKFKVVALSKNQAICLNSNESDWGTFTTSIPTQLDTPANLQVTNITCTGATLSWNNVANNNGYTLSLKNTSSSQTFKSEINKDVTSGTPPLNPGTTYTWSVIAKGDGTNYTNSEVADGGSFTTNYKITYDIKGGSWTACADGCVASGEDFTICSTEPSKDGHNFVGWSTADDTEAEYQAGETINNVSANTTLYAVWEQKKYTITWMANGQEYSKQQEAAYGTTLSVPSAPDAATYACDDKVFMGWTATPISGTKDDEPADLFITKTAKVEDAATTYYAVFAKGEGGSSDYKLVTSVPVDWSGTYLIVNTDNKKAWKGSATSDNGAIDVTITNNTITSNATTDNETFTIATMTGGYSIKGTSGKYISGTSGNNATNYNAAAQLNTISIDNNNNVTITSNTSVLRQNNSTASLFRYYKSSSYSSQHPIQLYKKGSGVNYTSFITTCCTSWTAPTLTYPTELEENGTATPQLGAGTIHGTTVTYTSSNPSILSVNSTTGEISAQAPGTATVTATWSGDGTYCSVSSTSNVITVKGSFSVIFKANGGTETMANQKADENNKIAQLNANQFTRTGYAFVGWNTTSAGTGTAYTDQQTNITLTKNLILYAQWAPVVTLNDAGNVTTTYPAIAGGSITLEDGANACKPYEFVGWTSVATGDWNEGINEPALVATTYTPNAPTTLYAVYKIQSEGNASAFKLSFEGGNGKTYYVGSYNSSPYLRGYSNITKEEAVTFIRTNMYPDNDTKYYIYMEHKSEYLYYNGTFNSTSSTPDENQGWVFHTVGDKIKLQSTYSYDPDYLSFSDRDEETINISTSTSGSEFNMLSAVTSTYVAAPLCNQEITITFETGNGDFVANAPTTNPLTKSRGDVITLPTCEYPGYEFMGWMKDEQQLDPSDIIGTYYTGDYTVDGVSSTITFYAYYKAIPEEVEFTGKDDAELKIYHYNGVDNYRYANTFVDEHAELAGIERCYDATTWKFTNVGNMQYYIQDETGKYLGAFSDSKNDFSLSNTPKIWNFTLVNGLWKIVCEDSPSRALMYISTGKTFANAAISNEGNGAYSYVTLGICPYPTYTTQPVLSQGFSITNTAMVTSASGQKVKAASALTLETRNIELPCTFTISAPNITFYDTNGNEVTELTSSTASEQFELHFAYKPTAENTMEYPTITITDDEMKTYTIKNRIYARSLPATFAIVAKVGNLWYALPSQGLNSTTPPAAYPIEVDDMADPTAVTAVPTNADWSLRGVYEASRSDATKDRYVANGDNLVFANNASPAMMLNASSSEKENYLLTDAQYNNYYSTNPGLYEWTPTTTDLETYQLTNEQRSRTLSVNTATVFGVHAQDKAVEQVRFLPITGRYTPAALQVVEWKEKSVVIMYNGDPAQTASVSVNGGAMQTTELSGDGVQKDIAVYELAATGLAANPTQRLSITIGAEKLLLPIPYIVNSVTTDFALLPQDATVAARQEVAKVADLVVLNGATLTAAGAKSNPYKFRNATIYGGGKLVIPSEKGFGVASLTLRLGSSWGAAEYEYKYPQFVLRGTFTNSAAIINYDYITDYDHWFHLVLPFAGDLGTIKYPTEFYGANVKPNNTGSWQIKRYAGEIRATGNYKAWVDIETEGETSTTAGQGYIFWGAPKKVSVNGGASTRQKWGIQRITMSVKADDAMKAENGDKAIQELSSYANVPNNSGKDNDQGWNLIGNPYMVNLKDMATTGLHACKLVEVIDPATGKPNGKWEWNDETNIRYLTIPSEHFDTYKAKTVSEAIRENALVPGRAFFVQLEGEADGITFATANRASLMPALLAENNDKPVDIETGIILSNETLQDEVNFWIKDGKTNNYEYNADYPKTPNNNHFNIYGVHTNGDLSWVATSPEYAAESMPIGYQVPAAGTFTLSVSETYYSENLQALFVTDHEASPEVTTNLVDEDYTFYVNQSETNNTRFTVSIILKPEKENTPTGVDNINTKANQPIKFLYQDKIYILRNGIIYDTTGKQVITINK